MHFVDEKMISRILAMLDWIDMKRMYASNTSGTKAFEALTWLYHCISESEVSAAMIGDG